MRNVSHWCLEKREIGTETFSGKESERQQLPGESRFELSTEERGSNLASKAVWEMHFGHRDRCLQSHLNKSEYFVVEGVGEAY